MSNKVLVPFEATHPGGLIKDELKERGLTQKRLSEMTGILASVISETITGKRSISLNMAIALEKALGIPADMWMNLQTQYDLDTANIAEREKQRKTVAVTVTIPVRDRNLLKEVSRKFGWACML
jgi:addiction module HigA family antidote